MSPRSCSACRLGAGHSRGAVTRRSDRAQRWPRLTGCDVLPFLPKAADVRVGRLVEGVFRQGRLASGLRGARDQPSGTRGRMAAISGSSSAIRMRLFCRPCGQEVSRGCGIRPRTGVRLKPLSAMGSPQVVNTPVPACDRVAARCWRAVQGATGWRGGRAPGRSRHGVTAPAVRRSPSSPGNPGRRAVRHRPAGRTSPPSRPCRCCCASPVPARPAGPGR